MSHLYVTKKLFFGNKISSVNELTDYKVNSFSKLLITNNKAIFDDFFFSLNDDDIVSVSKIFESLMEDNDETIAMFALTSFMFPNLSVHGVDENKNPSLLDLLKFQYDDKLYFTLKLNKVGQRVILDLYDCRASAEDGCVLANSLLSLNDSRSLISIYDLEKIHFTFLKGFRILQNLTQDIGGINCLMSMDKRYLVQDIVSLCCNDYMSRYSKVADFDETINDKLINRHVKYTFVLNGEQNKLMPQLSFARKVFDKEQFINGQNYPATIKGIDFNQFVPLFENWDKKIFYRDKVFRIKKFQI